MTPVAYTTYAPPGHICADCKQLVDAQERVVRLATDHGVSGGPDYRHLDCYGPGQQSKEAR